VCFTSLATLSISSIALGQSYDRGDQRNNEVTEQSRSLPSQPPAAGFPATDSRGVATPDKQVLPGSGKMAKEDRTGSTSPSGTRSTSIPNTGAIDTVGRVTKAR